MSKKKGNLMSLVPILYTSLLLFGILMFVIISVSYIAYKIRNKNEDEKEEIEYLGQNSHRNYLTERRNPVQSTIKVVPTIKRPELRKTSPLPYGMQRTTVVNNNETETKSRRTSYREDYSKAKTYPTTSYSTRTNSSSFKNRLEIVNKLRPEEAPKEKFVVSGSGSVALPKYYENFKAIQYYSDDEDEYLYKPSNNYS